MSEENAHLIPLPGTDESGPPAQQLDSDDVVTQLRTGAAAESEAPVISRPRWGPKEVRVSRSPWVIRGLIGAFAFILIGEMLLLYQAQPPPDMHAFESGPTLEVFATPMLVPLPDPPTSTPFPDPPTPTPLPDPPTPTPIPDPPTPTSLPPP